MLSALIRARSFTLMNLIAGTVTATVAFGVAGAFLPLTLYLQSVQGPSAARAGPAIAVMPLASVTAGISGRSSRRPALRVYGSAAWCASLRALESSRPFMRTATAHSKMTTITSLWSKSDDIPWDSEMARRVARECPDASPEMARRVARECNVPYRQPNKAPVKP